MTDASLPVDVDGRRIGLAAAALASLWILRRRKQQRDHRRQRITRLSPAGGVVVRPGAGGCMPAPHEVVRLLDEHGLVLLRGPCSGWEPADLQRFASACFARAGLRTYETLPASPADDGDANASRAHAPGLPAVRMLGTRPGRLLADIGREWHMDHPNDCATLLYCKACPPSPPLSRSLPRSLPPFARSLARSLPRILSHTHAHAHARARARATTPYHPQGLTGEWGADHLHGQREAL